MEIVSKKQMWKNFKNVLAIYLGCGYLGIMIGTCGTGHFEIGIPMVIIMLIGLLICCVLFGNSDESDI